jgi:hypothetical protein
MFANNKMSASGHARFMESMTAMTLHEICAEAHINVADSLAAGDVTPGTLSLIFDADYATFTSTLSVIDGISAVHITALYAMLKRRSLTFCSTPSEDGTPTERELARRASKHRDNVKLEQVEEAIVMVEAKAQPREHYAEAFSSGEESTPASLYLKGILTWLGPDDLRNKEKLRKLLKSVRSGQLQSDDSSLAAVLQLLRSGSGCGDDDEDCRLPAGTKRAATAARVRKSQTEASKLFRGIRSLLSSTHFFKDDMETEHDFTTLDRWIKLCDYVAKLADRHGWTVAADYWCRFMNEHDYELVRPEDSDHLSFTVLWPEMLADTVEDAAPPAPRHQPRGGKGGDGEDNGGKGNRNSELWAAFAGTCIVCHGRGHSARDCPKRKDVDNANACSICGKEPCPHASIIHCAAKTHSVKAKQS